MSKLWMPLLFLTAVRAVADPGPTPTLYTIYASGSVEGSNCTTCQPSELGIDVGSDIGSGAFIDVFAIDRDPTKAPKEVGSGNNTVVVSSRLGSADHLRVVVWVNPPHGSADSFGVPTVRAGSDWDRIFEQDQQIERDYIVQSLMTSTSTFGQNVDTIKDAHSSDADAGAAAKIVLGGLPTAGSGASADEVRSIYDEALRLSRANYAASTRGLTELESSLVAISVAARAVETSPNKGTRDAFVATWNAFSAAFPPPARTIEPYTAAVGSRQYQLARNFHVAPWRLGVFDLPITAASNTITVAGNSVGSGNAPSDPKPASGRVSLWFVGVARDADPQIKWTVAKTKQQTFFSAVMAALPAMFKGASALAAGGESTSSDKPDNGPSAWGKLMLFTSTTYLVPITYRYPLTDLAPFRTVVASTNVESDHTYTASLCDGDCASAQAKPLTSVTIDAPPTRGWGLLGGVTWNTFATEMVSSNQWLPIQQLGGGVQLYQLGRIKQPLEAITSSLFISYHTADKRFAVGAGPAILIGTSSANLSQWTLNGFVRIAASTYFTAGFGGRIVGEPAGVRIGDTQQSMAPPTVTTASHGEWIFNAGLAFDLVDAGTAVASVFGVKQ